MTNIEHFTALDIRVGSIIAVENSKAAKPTYRIRVDLGPEIGSKVSVAGFTGYKPHELLNRKVICICNLEPRIMGPETSEVLILGADDENSITRHLTIDGAICNGSKIY